MGKMLKYKNKPAGMLFAFLLTITQFCLADDHLVEINRITAKVNDRIVTWGEIRQAMQKLNLTDQEMKERASEFLDGKVDRLLASHAFTEKGMAIPDSFIEQEFNKRMIGEFNDDRKLFREYLRSLGKTDREYREDIREEIIYQHMLSSMRRLKEDISPANVEEYYRKNASKFKTNAKVRIREIVLKPIADEPITVLLQQAKKIELELDKGRKFEEIAKTVGQSAYRENGGDWGLMISEREMRSEEIRNQAFNLEEGEVSKPFKVELLERKQDGSVAKSGKVAVYIIQISKKEVSGLQPLEELRTEIESLISREIEADNQRKWLSKVKEDAYVRVILPE